MNSTHIEVVTIKKGLISDEEMVIANNVVAFLMLSASLVGVVTNSLIIRTFILMGLGDGLNMTFFGLAVSDLGYTLFGGVFGAANIVTAVENEYELTHLPVHPRVFVMFGANIAFMCLITTCMTTTYLAVARCMCVVMPFRFKNFFTMTKSLYAQGVFVLVAMSAYVPVLARLGAARRYDPSLNKTRIILLLLSQRLYFKNIAVALNGVVITPVSTVVIFICIIIMAKYIRESMKFRNQSSSAKAGSDEKEKSDGKLSGKELQAVRQVLVISIIYTASMLPRLVLSLTRLIEDELEFGKRYGNMWLLGTAVIMTVTLINSSTTLFVYYIYNSKFRSLCFSVTGK